MEIQSELGLRIRYYRKQRNLSQEKLAELCSLHPTYIGQLERGEKNATIESIFHIAKGLNISLGELLAHLGEIPESTEKTDSLPLNIYRKMMLLPPEKQKRLSYIMDAVLSFSEI